MFVCGTRSVLLGNGLVQCCCVKMRFCDAVVISAAFILTFDGFLSWLVIIVISI